MRAILTLASIAGAAALLAGCGSGNGTAADPVAASAPTSSGSAHSPAPHVVKLPDCSSVWTVGSTVPGSYKGCQVDGTKDASIVYHCEIGSRVAIYGDDLYAILGRQVVKVSPSRNANADWKYLYNHCVG